MDGRGMYYILYNKMTHNRVFIKILAQKADIKWIRFRSVILKVKNITNKMSILCPPNSIRAIYGAATKVLYRVTNNFTNFFKKLI